jgi:hypothetical protein
MLQLDDLRGWVVNIFFQSCKGNARTEMRSRYLEPRGESACTLRCIDKDVEKRGAERY